MKTAPPTRLVVRMIVAALLLPLAGCALSESMSDSSNSSWESSANSSGSVSPDSTQAGYRDDVRDYTAAYVESGGHMAQLDQKLGDLAKARGITNWEEDPTTYDGIGRGLGKAKVGAVELDTYVQRLSRGSADRASAIRKGYAAEN